MIRGDVFRLGFAGSTLGDINSYKQGNFVRDGLTWYKLLMFSVWNFDFDLDSGTLVCGTDILFTTPPRNKPGNPNRQKLIRN